MKQLKKLTRDMKIIMSKKRFKCENWGLVKTTETGFTIRNKLNGKEVDLDW